MHQADQHRHLDQRANVSDADVDHHALKPEQWWQQAEKDPGIQTEGDNLVAAADIDGAEDALMRCRRRRDLAHKLMAEHAGEWVIAIQ